MKKNEFEVGGYVYHATPESEKGFVVEATYYVKARKWLYLVTFSATTPSAWFEEHELRHEKTF